MALSIKPLAPIPDYGKVLSEVMRNAALMSRANRLAAAVAGRGTQQLQQYPTGINPETGEVQYTTLPKGIPPKMVQEFVAKQQQFQMQKRVLADPELQEQLARIPDVDVASADKILKNVRGGISQRLSKEMGVPAQELMRSVIAPYVADIKTRKEAINESTWSGVWDRIRLGASEAYDAFASIGDSAKEQYDTGRAIAAKRQEVTANNAWLLDQERRRAAGEGPFSAFTGEGGGILPGIAATAGDLLPMVPVMGGSAVGTLLGGPIGGAAAGGAIMGALEPQAVANRIAAMPELTEEQAVAAIDEARLPAMATGFVSGAAPLGAGAPAGRLLARAAIPGVSRVARAVATPAKGPIGRYMQRSVASGAEMGLLNAAQLAGQNVIVGQTTGQPVPVTQGLLDAVQAGLLAGPAFGFMPRPAAPQPRARSTEPRATAESITPPDQFLLPEAPGRMLPMGEPRRPSPVEPMPAGAGTAAETNIYTAPDPVTPVTPDPVTPVTPDPVTPAAPDPVISTSVQPARGRIEKEFVAEIGKPRSVGGIRSLIDAFDGQITPDRMMELVGIKNLPPKKKANFDTALSDYRSEAETRVAAEQEVQAQRVAGADLAFDAGVEADKAIADMPALELLKKAADEFKKMEAAEIIPENTNAKRTRITAPVEVVSDTGGTATPAGVVADVPTGTKSLVGQDIGNAGGVANDTPPITPTPAPQTPGATDGGSPAVKIGGAGRVAKPNIGKGKKNPVPVPKQDGTLVGEANQLTGPGTEPTAPANAEANSGAGIPERAGVGSPVNAGNAASVVQGVAWSPSQARTMFRIMADALTPKQLQALAPSVKGLDTNRVVDALIDYGLGIIKPGKTNPTVEHTILAGMLKEYPDMQTFSDAFVEAALDEQRSLFAQGVTESNTLRDAAKRLMDQDEAARGILDQTTQRGC